MDSYYCPARIIAHRGACFYAPENTLESFAVARRQGASWIETDVKLTADNVPVLIHDETLERTTNGIGLVAETNLEELQKLDAGAWFSPQYKGAAVPTLEEAIKLFAELSLDCNFEIKPCPGREEETAEIVMRDLSRRWPQEWPRPLVSSFALESLRIARRSHPEWPLGLLLEDYPNNWLDLARELRVVSIHCWSETLTQEWAAKIKEEGFVLLVYTINDPAVARRLFDWGVDGIFTDAPARFLDAAPN